MKIKMIIFHILAFLLLPVCVFAAESAAVSLSADKVFAGDIFILKITAELAQDARISANQNISFKEFEMADFSVNRISDIPNVYELIFKMAAYKTGILEIEPITVFYLNPDGTNNLFFTPAAQIIVESVLGEAYAGDIKDIKAPAELKMKTVYVFFLLFLSAVFVFISVLLMKDISVKRKKAKEKYLTPLEKALLDLNNIYSSPENIANTKAFYYRLFEILRAYFSDKYGYNAMEMTTAEFFECAKKFLPPDITVNEFKNYLKVFNLARYAGFKPAGGQVEESVSFTKKLLETI